MSKLTIGNSNEITIPDKLFFKIGEVCDLVGVQAHVLRYWESEFPMLQPQKNRAGQRTYRRKDVEMALRIRALLYDDGHTITEAKRVLSSNKRALKSQSSSVSAVSIFADEQRPCEFAWRASVGVKEAFGKTAGEALDSITSQLGGNSTATVIVRRLLPDQFFTASQQQRLSELMSKWRMKRDTGSALSPQEQAELEALIEAELAATSYRSEQISHELNK